jgi:ubiquinone/menaquinone biosynthesis C-methylase UbiE
VIDAVRRQRTYYARTAAHYDDMHVDDHDEHGLALRHIAGYLDIIQADSVLDTGCGTGRAIHFLKQRFPELRVHGNDPSAELLAASGLPSDVIDCVGSEQLPYPDGSFDAVVECGVLHHVAEPSRIVGEMLRVARKAVFLSDSNIYGQGKPIARVAKLALASVGALDAVNWIRRGGKRWYYSDGDGVAYSYSVFDSYKQLARACDRVVAIPLTGSGRTALLGSSTVLLCGFKSLPTGLGSQAAD